MAEQPTLYDRVVRITLVYLGPAADRFISRQVQNHLHKQPEELSEEDLSRLIDWIRVAVSFLTEDSELIEEYTSQLAKLSGRPCPQEVPHHGNAALADA
ncbi:MAG TPA: hypothetical protein VHC98_02425 [Candidatus Saccharimonadales bacterium]|nr:hypothetical protein [Candidatus Saccharimonadales bacterium]